MGTIKKLKNKLSAKGSVLVFTLIILFIILAAAIGISSVSVLERKGARSTDVSVQSFQIANSGAEIILKKIADNNSGILNNLGTCAGGKLTGFISSGKNYEITFYTSDGLPITDCTTDVSEIDKIKSIGSYANTARAIEVAVAAGVPKMEFYTFYASGSNHGGGGDNIDCSWYQVKWEGAGEQLGEESFCTLNGKDLDPDTSGNQLSQAYFCATYGDNIYQCQIRLKNGKWEYGAPIGDNYLGCVFTCMRFK